MKRELQFITVCPTDKYFTWQVHLWLESLRELNYTSKATVLLFNPKNRPENPVWKELQTLFPEVEFCTYEDDGSVAPFLGMYIPILRLYTMKRYCLDHPEISQKAVFYCDSDIIFMKSFNINHLLDDDVNYLSDTNSYISASYFDSKFKDVIPEKLEKYKSIDVLNQAASILGINRQICEKNNLHSGGTQYLLKNTNAEFWETIFHKCIPLLTYLRNINKEYYINENTGLQSWTCDMWLVLWQIWKTGAETKVVPELNFAWSTDPIIKLETYPILHNAGIVSETGNGYPAFYKGKYHMGTDPTKDPYLDVVLNNETSQKYCTWFYATKINEIKNKYNLNY
jgi:hypothetical protein